MKVFRQRDERDFCIFAQITLKPYRYGDTEERSLL